MCRTWRSARGCVRADPLAMTTIYTERTGPRRAGGRDRRRRRLRQPGSVVGAEPARQRAARPSCACGGTTPATRRSPTASTRPTSRPRTTPTIVCVLVPDDVIPSLPLRGRPDGCTIVASGYTLAFDRLDGRRRPRDGRAPHARSRGPPLLRGRRRVHHRGRRAPRRHRPRAGARARRSRRAIGGLRQGAIELTHDAGSGARPRRRAGAVARAHGREQRVRRHDDRSTASRSRRSSPSSCCRARSSAPTGCSARSATRCSPSSTRRRASTASCRAAGATTISTSARSCASSPTTSTSGRFADEWDAERDAGYPHLRELKEQHAGPAVRAIRSRPAQPARARRRVVLSAYARLRVVAPVRIGIVGVGNIATLNVPGYLAHEQCEVVALCDPRREVLERRGQRVVGRPTATTRLDDLLADDDIDAVEILEPDSAARGPRARGRSPPASTCRARSRSRTACRDGRRMVEAAHDAGVDLPRHRAVLPLPAAREGADLDRVGRHRPAHGRAHQDGRRPHRLDVPGRARPGGLRRGASTTRARAATSSTT